jgi:5-methylcytosine-specific restriction endonuclease McrA
MRVPKDISLYKYIKRLLEAGKIEQFYHTEDWRELREEVLYFYHYECQECLQKGIYTKADCVHHVNEVKHRPDLALSRYYTDIKGNNQPNLVPLCNQCHNIVHDKLGEYQNKDRFTNEERW